MYICLYQGYTYTSGAQQSKNSGPAVCFSAFFRAIDRGLKKKTPLFKAEDAKEIFPKYVQRKEGREGGKGGRGEGGEGGKILLFFMFRHSNFLFSLLLTGSLMGDKS